MTFFAWFYLVSNFFFLNCDHRISVEALSVRQPKNIFKKSLVPFSKHELTIILF